MVTPTLRSAEINALTEVCNLGMDHAATALSQLMGKSVEIQVPRLRFLDTEGFSRLLAEQEVTALHLQILGNVRGSIIIILHPENSSRILELLLGRGPCPGEALSEMENATLLEVGNILASACLNALGTSLKMTLLPSVPTMIRGSAPELMSRVMENGGESGTVVMLDTVFSVSDAFCGGSIFLIPATASLEAILAALGNHERVAG